MNIIEDKFYRQYLTSLDAAERIALRFRHYQRWIGEGLFGKGEFSRLEPVNRTYSVEEGVQARVKDPLWMLGRQWQMGEFQAESGGKPIRTEISYRTREINKICKTPQQSSDNSSTSTEEPTPDTYSLIEDIKIPLEREVEMEETNAEGKQHSPSWVPPNLEYRFNLKGDSLSDSEVSTVLTAKEYDGSQLDWYSFNIRRDIHQVMLDGIEYDKTLLPNNLSYKGMPSPRWWKFEDSRIDVGDINRPHLNYLTMILLEFSLLYSNDWYFLPLKQPVGTLRQISRFRVIDSFGVIFDVNPIIDTSSTQNEWEIFTLTSDFDDLEEEIPDAIKNNGSLFYLPNNLVDGGLESKPIEDVRLLRDELANLVWAIENKYQINGEIINRSDEKQPSIKELVDTPVHFMDTSEDKLISREDMENLEDFNTDQIGDKFLGPLPKFELMSYVPAHWIPYLARVERSTDDDADIRPRQIKLRRGRTSLDVSKPQFKGVMLGESIQINEEEVTRQGIKLQRVWQLGRDADGKPHKWISRKKLPDEKQQSSGLRFDYLIDGRDK